MPHEFDSDEPRPSADPDDAREREAQAIRGLQSAYKRMREEIGKVVIGQQDVVDQLLIALFSRGHCLMVGVPGLAKTLLVSTIGRILQLAFRRIQFTPDLMPSDITGTDVLQHDPLTSRHAFQFMQGPLFTNILLADEINRTPPKTQAALLEAMQERHVTVGSNTYRLPLPFFVLATQNPIEQEGTYALPEAQLDRFMFNIIVKYPTAAEELRILKQTTGSEEVVLTPALTGKQILALQEVVRRVPVAEHVYIYARDIVRATRPNEPEATSFIKEYVSWGAGPRAGQNLIVGAKARAILEGRFHVSTEDIKAVAHPVLRHRLVTTFHADSERVVEHLAQFGHVLGVHRRVRVDERDAAFAFEQQRFLDRRGERAAIHRGDHLERVQHAQHRGRMAAVGGPVVVADQRARELRGRVRHGVGRHHADRLEVVAHPLLVARLLVHVFVKEVTDLLVRVTEPAGGRGADRVEVPDDVVQLKQQTPVALDRHAVRDGVEHDRMGLESAARFIGADDEVRKQQGHQLLQRHSWLSPRGFGLSPAPAAFVPHCAGKHASVTCQA